MPKNIVVFSDGTGQEGGKGSNTNVYKLFNMILDRSPTQIAFYDRGLGTGWRKFTGKAGGRGISQNIRECYEFIFSNFMAGDQIYLFGFSRGAATVRSLSSFIHHFGILPKSRSELIDQAYRIYRKSKNEKDLDAKARAFVARHHRMWTKIRFLGVWDTVAALGLPFKALDRIVDWVPFWKHKYHDLRLSPSVEHAVQALAIDDQRKTFHPLPWETVKREANKSIKQVWFCGMHTDVGGGYAEQGLSDIALDWMVREATSRGLEIYPKHDVRIDPDSDGFMHDSRGTLMTKFYRRKVRTWNAERHGKPVVHKSVTLRKKNRKNEASPPYDPWILKMEHDVEE
jgi:uncharacterized protein (DUF2235 family)